MPSSTENLFKTGRSFFAIAIAGIGFQHLFYGDFHPVILPAWPSVAGVRFWAYFAGLSLIGAGFAIFFEKKARAVCLILGTVFLILLCFGHIPYEIIIDPNRKIHLGLWTNALKELALSGGAFVVAGSFSEREADTLKKNALLMVLEKMIPAGSIFFSITMISFGIDHFYYTGNVATLVPPWIPYPVFWTYFAGIALIGSGVAIILKTELKKIGTMLGLMIFIWFVLLHVPRAIANPFAGKGNEVTSAFTALAFSGIALVIAGGRYTKNKA